MKRLCLLLFIIIFLQFTTVYAEEKPTIYIDLWSSTLYLIKNEKVVAQFKISGGREKILHHIGKPKGWGGGLGQGGLGLMYLRGIMGFMEPISLG